MSDVFCVDFPTYIIYSRFLFSSIIYAGNQRSCKNIRFYIKIVLRKFRVWNLFWISLFGIVFPLLKTLSKMHIYKWVYWIWTYLTVIQTGSYLYAKFTCQSQNKQSPLPKKWSILCKTRGMLIECYSVNWLHRWQSMYARWGIYIFRRPRSQSCLMRLTLY